MQHVAWSELEATIRENPTRETPLRLSGASIETENPRANISWLPTGCTEDTSCVITDGIALALWAIEPLYHTATPAVRHTLEKELATSLIEQIAVSWKEHGGRSRGWIRAHLSEDLGPRAGGVQPSADTWIHMHKRCALLLDYICVVKQIRVALWYPSQKTLTVFPAAGGVSSAAPFIQLNCDTRHPIICPEPVVAYKWLPVALTMSGFSWMPPATVRNNMTIAQLRSAMPSQMVCGNRLILWKHLHWHLLCEALSPLGEALPLLGESLSLPSKALSPLGEALSPLGEALPLPGTALTQ